MRHRDSGSRRRFAIFAALLLLGLAALLGGPAMPVRPASAQVAGTSDLNAIACATSTTCYAVGEQGFGTPNDVGIIVPITNGVAGAVETVPGTYQLLGIACSGAAVCFAVGVSSAVPETGVLMSITNGAGGSLQTVTGTGQLDAVACASTTMCYAVGYFSAACNGKICGAVVPIMNGSPGEAQPVAGAFFLDGIACPSNNTCLAVGWADASSFTFNGVVVPVTNGTPGPIQTASGTTGPDGVACSSSSACFAVGNTTNSNDAACPSGSTSCGVLVPVTNGALGSSQIIPGTQELFGATCSSGATCYAAGLGSSNGGTSGFAASLPITNGIPDLALTEEPAGGQLNGVACPTSSVCLALGTVGKHGGGFLTQLPSFIATGIQPVTGTFTLNAIACASGSTCYAVGTNGSAGLVVPVTSGSVGSVQTVSSALKLTGITCASSSACFAVGLTISTNCADSFGSCGAVVPITNGTAGTALPVAGTDLLTAIACADSTHCVAVGNASTENVAACTGASRQCGVVVPITNGAAGSVQRLNDVPLNGIACSGTTTCDAVGFLASRATTCSPNAGECGAIVPITSGTAGAVQMDTSVERFDGIACTDSTTCYAVGVSQADCGNSGGQCGVVVPLVSGSAGSAQTVLGTSELFGLACPRSSTCYTAGWDLTGGGGNIDGAVVPIISGTAGADEGVTVADQFAGIACTDSTTCYAAGKSNASPYGGAVVTLTTEIIGPPAVMSVDPVSGASSGGTAVAISGTGFTGATAVQFGGTAAETFTVISNSQISATSPALVSGMACVSGGPAPTTPCAADVSVATAAGASAAGPADQFSYASCKLGDANCNGVVDATDALCVLRLVAQLPGTGACPKPLKGNPDVNNDLADDGPAGADATDALCILRGVAHLPATSACPQIPAP